MTFSAIVPLPAAVPADGSPVFTPLAGLPPLIRAVRLLAPGTEPRRPEVVVATAAGWVDEARDCLARHGLSDAAAVVECGQAANRGDCIAAGLVHLQGAPRPPRYVLIHDHRHPLAPPAVRDRVVAALRAGAAAAIPTQPFTDSAKLVDARGSIAATVDRSALRTAQYPRGFTAAGLAQLIAARATGGFDELSEALHAGVAVTLVDGDPDGVVVELPRARRFLEAVISSRPPERR